MISIKIDGEIVDIKSNMADAMRKVSLYMKESILDNIESSGRPSWLPLKNGAPATLGGLKGQIAQAIQNNYGGNFAEAGIGSFPVLYAAIHQFGGVINHPGSDKFQAFMVGGRMVFTHGTVPHQIQIQPRPYIMFQLPEDVDSIMDILKNRGIQFILPGENNA